jgi:hypothetical protein
MEDTIFKRVAVPPDLRRAALQQDIVTSESGHVQCTISFVLNHTPSLNSQKSTQVGELTHAASYHWLTYIDFWNGTPCCLAWLVAGCVTHLATKLVIESKHQLQPGPADFQLLVGRCRLGGIAYVYVWLECSYDPTEGHPGQHEYTFLIGIQSTSHLSFNFVCLLCSRYLSQWYAPLSPMQPNFPAVHFATVQICKDDFRLRLPVLPWIVCKNK